MAMLAIQEHDRPPACSLKLPVDPLGFISYFLEKVLVPRDVRATGGPNLHEYELPLVHRIRLQQTFDGKETLQYAFGVIDPIDAHAEKDGIHPKFAKNLGPLFFAVEGNRRSAGQVGKIHTDGKRTDHADMLV